MSKKDTYEQDVKANFKKAANYLLEILPERANLASFLVCSWQAVVMADMDDKEFIKHHIKALEGFLEILKENVSSTDDKQ